MADLDQKLTEYGKSKVYPRHMPGHKRQPLYDMDPFSMDITEIYGFDNLNHPESIYQDLNQRIAALYGADHAHLMVNGSTGGNYVMLHAATDVNDTILVARNCHKSIYHMIEMRQLNCVSIEPAFSKRDEKEIEGNPLVSHIMESEIPGPIDPQSVEKILDRAFYKTALSGTFVTPDSLTTIGTTAFYDTQLEQVRLGEKVSAVGEAAFGGCLKLSGFEVAAGNKCYKAVDGVLYDIADTLLLAYPQADARTSYSLPKTVKSIAMSAFDCAAKLEELHINEGVAVMPVSMCYGDTVLKKIYMPSTTKLLKAGALDNCKQLAELHIRAVDPPEVETGAFGVMFRNYKMNLYVPKGSKSKYENASGWSDSFLSINEEDAPAEPVYRVLMTTSHAIGEYIGLSMQTGGEDVEVTGAEYDSPGYFKVTSQNIEIKGKITRLDCSSNQLTLLDVTQEPALVELYCDDNKLDTLKLGNLPALTRLYCGGNQLSSIDLSQLPSLQDFSCWGNNLTALGLNGNPAMTSLICRDNKLQGTLDLSSNPKINQVNCYNNALTFIKLAPNTELKHIELERNNINGDNMTRFMTSLPTYVAFPADEWDDYGGLNLQGLYVTEIDQTYEKNVAFDTDVNIAKGKGWPVYAINIDDYGMTKPTAYDGIPTTGISSLDRGQAVLHVATSGSQALVTGLSAGDIVRLYDLQGRSVVVLMAQGESLDIDLGGMARGVYVLKTKQGSCKIDVK